MPRTAKIALTLSLLLIACASARAELELAGLFSDHAVLQADAELPVWGWADPGEHVTIRLGDQQATADTSPDGRWTAKLPAMHRSTSPLLMTVTTANGESLKVNDILIGEVWIGSGQSNMAMTIDKSARAEQFVKDANQPTIRMLRVGRQASTRPAKDVTGHWAVCSPKTLPTLSAVLYHFGRSLHDKLDTPVGLINSSWGGTPIQAWMPPQAFAGGDAAMQQYDQRISAIYPSTATLPSGAPPPRAAAHLRPAQLYNGMIAPLIPYAIRGVTWYQGENNVHQGDVSDYAAMMQAMVDRWRGEWKQGDWPFLFVQLAPYGKYRSAFASPDALPEMWEQQTRALSMIRNSGMAPISDIGDVDNIHPTNKHDVGRRLALIALATTYGQRDVVYEGPTYKSHETEGDRVRVHLTGVGSGLTTRDGKPPDHFEIAGEDGKFVRANAKIDGEALVVSSDQVKAPKQVRFAWSATASPNLMNREGLPAIAFRAGGR
jgi:sialate O-acetylesterase